jgi:hypothetical protein
MPSSERGQRELHFVAKLGLGTHVGKLCFPPRLEARATKQSFHPCLPKSSFAAR